LDNQREKYKIENLNTETLLLTIRSFNIGANAEHVEHKQFVQKLDSVFLEIKNTSKIKNVVIDLRENGGGSDPNETILCTYFSKKPFRENVEAYTLTNEIPFPQYYNFGSEIDSLKKIKQKELEDELKMYHNVYKNQKWYQNDTFNTFFQPHKNRFEGPLYIIINPNVASAASHFASLAKAYTHAVFIGEETTGGYYEHVGHYSLAYTLPNSKIAFGFSIVHVTQDAVKLKSQPQGRGILPDYEVKQTLKDFLNNTDTQMEFVKKLINK
jgi:C-terminal processing protease CtpA/Prc